jgi:hypothetical protein
MLYLYDSEILFKGGSALVSHPRPRLGWEDNIKIGLGGMGYEYNMWSGLNCFRRKSNGGLL